MRPTRRPPAARRRQDAGAGFTLIELLVVMAIIGTLLGLGVGYMRRLGAGNVLIQAANKMVTLLDAARNTSYGNERAYVEITPNPSGGATIRAFRYRDVFHWTCEDLSSASEDGVLHLQGSVAMDPNGPPSQEGRHVRFERGGTVSLGNPTWLDMPDGFSIRCRLYPDSQGGFGAATLFRKGKVLKISLLAAQDGRYDVEARIQVLPDAQGHGGGEQILTTGQFGKADVPEWHGPLLSGRWQDLHVSYDRNRFTIEVDGRTRALRKDLDRKLKIDPDADFLIGGGYQGGFDSLLIGGIFEDDTDRFDVPGGVDWVDPATGKPETKPLSIHFLNRGLDPASHSGPITLVFEMGANGDVPGQRGARRVVHVALSGEATVELPGQ